MCPQCADSTLWIGHHRRSMWNPANLSLSPPNSVSPMTFHPIGEIAQTQSPGGPPLRTPLSLAHLGTTGRNGVDIDTVAQEWVHKADLIFSDKHGTHATIAYSEPTHFTISGRPAVRYTATATDIPPRQRMRPVISNIRHRRHTWIRHGGSDDLPDPVRSGSPRVPRQGSDRPDHLDDPKVGDHGRNSSLNWRARIRRGTEKGFDHNSVRSNRFQENLASRRTHDREQDRLADSEAGERHQ